MIIRIIKFPLSSYNVFMEIILGNINLEKLNNGYVRASGIVYPPDAPEFVFVGTFNEDMLLEIDEDLQLIGSRSDWDYHRIDEARELIKRKVFLKRLEVVLGVENKEKQA